MEPNTDKPTSKPIGKLWFKRLNLLNVFLTMTSLIFVVVGILVAVHEGGFEVWLAVLIFAGSTWLHGQSVWRNIYPQAEPKERVHFDETRITRTMVNGQTETIAWAQVDKICIWTTDDGPFSEDLWWVFQSNTAPKKGCMVANGAEGLKPLISHIQTFEGFDNMQVIEASGCSHEAEFLLWTRPASEPSTELLAVATPSNLKNS